MLHFFSSCKFYAKWRDIRSGKRQHLGIMWIEPLTVDALFISSDAATADTGLTTPYPHEAALKRAMIRSARRVIALVDYSKFGKDEFIRFAEWSDVDVLVTNTELDESVVQQIESTGVTVVLA